MLMLVVMLILAGGGEGLPLADAGGAANDPDLVVLEIFESPEGRLMFKSSDGATGEVHQEGALEQFVGDRNVTVILTAELQRAVILGKRRQGIGPLLDLIKMRLNRAGAKQPVMVRLR